MADGWADSAAALLAANLHPTHGGQNHAAKPTRPPLRAIKTRRSPRRRPPHGARSCAETPRVAISTHAHTRSRRFSPWIASASANNTAAPKKTAGMGGIERWDGHRGVGNLNATASMQQAIDLAKQCGIGGVALGNTNHWMRGGSYGWQAAEQGLFAICWTNTLANLPAWGAKTPTLANSPLIMAIPRPGGHVVLDMAASQFSYGTLAAYSKRGQPLPVDGGFDTAETVL